MKVSVDSAYSLAEAEATHYRIRRDIQQYARRASVRRLADEMFAKGLVRFEERSEGAIIYTTASVELPPCSP